MFHDVSLCLISWPDHNWRSWTSLELVKKIWTILYSEVQWGWWNNTSTLTAIYLGGIFSQIVMQNGWVNIHEAQGQRFLRPPSVTLPLSKLITQQAMLKEQTGGHTGFCLFSFGGLGLQSQQGILSSTIDVLDGSESGFFVGLRNFGTMGKLCWWCFHLFCFWINCQMLQKILITTPQCWVTIIAFFKWMQNWFTV